MCTMNKTLSHPQRDYIAGYKTDKQVMRKIIIHYGRWQERSKELKREEWGWEGTTLDKVIKGDL